MTMTVPHYKRTLTNDEKQRLDDLYDHLSDLRDYRGGYPCNQAFDYAEIHRFLDFSINNIGDPFGDSNFRLNTHELEREVVNTFAELMRATPGECWGYINNGGTEGNLYGLYLAREMMGNGVVYFSEDTHYSVAKILRLLNIPHLMIRTLYNGQIDCEDLRATIGLRPDLPPIVLANIGTTMKGAIDDIDAIQRIFKDLGINKHYIHCDAALSGMILPFVDNPPPFRFCDGIDSIAISGHKMIGSPLPCGVVLAKQRYVDQIAQGIEYVGVMDTTITGSRNAFTPLILWYALRRHGAEGFGQIVNESIELADYTIDLLKRSGIKAWRNEHSVTVVLPRPSAALSRRWQLAVKDDIAHIITLPTMDEAMADKMCAELAEDLQATGRTGT